MALRVPQEQVPLVKKLLELPPTKVDEFIVALSAARPAFSTFKLAEEVRQHVGIPAPLLDGILRVVAGLYRTRDREGTTIESFVDVQVLNALKSANVFVDEDAIKSGWPKLRKFFVETLAMHRSVGTASKAGPILTQHERIFQGARIITDVRPVFHPDVEAVPDAAVVIHMLRITQRNNQGQHSDIFVAMDSNDIRSLRSTIDRAIKKEETIKSAMSKAQIECLDPEEIY